MRIGIDARYMASTPSGIGRYSRALLTEMFRLAPEHEWVVLVHESFPGGWPAESPPRLELHRSPHRPVSRHTLGPLGRWIGQRRLDLWHSLFPLAPSRCPVPSVVTVHDLQPLLCPGWTGGRPWPLPWMYRIFYRRAYGRAVAQARRIIAVSTWTAETIRAQWPGAETRTAVIPEALEPHWLAEEPPPDSERASTVLFVGSTRPNKNLHNLVEAFALLASQASVPPDLRLRLIMVRDRHWPSVARRIEAQGLGGRVDVVSPQGDQGLRGEYRRAGVLAFVGTHEGFGLPPLEAMASGCPVVAARHAALPETCGEAAEFVDPESPASIAEGLRRLLTDSGRRSHLTERGREWASRRSWRDAAERTLEEYGRAVGVA